MPTAGAAFSTRGSLTVAEFTESNRQSITGFLHPLAMVLANLGRSPQKTP